MPRPMKCRKVCYYPETIEFGPVGFDTCDSEAVIMAVDEYETIRLIDKEGLSQEECAASMQIGRTTVQRIYESARRKLAKCIVEGRVLKIEGGDFLLCDGGNGQCHRGECFKKTYYQRYKKDKGEKTMRIAVTYDNGQIFQHFGHTEYFKVYDVEDDKILSSEVVDTNGSGHGALAGVLNALNADALICGGIGGGAQNALAAAGIRLYAGVSGDADAAVEALLAGNLEYGTEANCDHHGHDHGEGHQCGNHGCGSGHSCGHH